MQNSNVLVFPCGTEIGQEIHAALKHEKSVTLFGASSVEDHGRMVFARYTPDIPFVDNERFNQAFEACITANNIDFIIPAHDSVLLYLAENREKFSAILLAPDVAICRICRSKQKTYEALNGENFVPAFYSSCAQVPAYPVFMKPDEGQGSHGIFLATDEAQCAEAKRLNPTLLICEYLPGKEYTIDCYSDKKGTLLFANARERVRTKAGISVQSKIHGNDPKITYIAERIAARIGPTGAWFFQLKQSSSGDLKLLEVAPRIAGTMALHRVQGVNFPLLTLFEALEQPISVLTEAFDCEIERALINRYTVPISYQCLYLDLDDTLIVHGKLNMTLLRLVYQCQDKNILVKLITRHYRNPKITLADFKLHEGLFDEIIWISNNSAKSGYMQTGEAIFIDDSFRERKDVSKKLGIPVFAPDVGEALLDWRL